MFGKQKKLPAPPKPPTIDQIIEDLETFKEEVNEHEPVRQLPVDSKNLDRDYWHLYQTFLEDNKTMQTTYNQLEQMKYSVQSKVSEITETKGRIETDVSKQLEELTKLRSPVEN